MTSEIGDYQTYLFRLSSRWVLCSSGEFRYHCYSTILRRSLNEEDPFAEIEIDPAERTAYIRSLLFSQEHIAKFRNDYLGFLTSLVTSLGYNQATNFIVDLLSIRYPSYEILQDAQIDFFSLITSNTFMTLSLIKTETPNIGTEIQIFNDVQNLAHRIDEVSRTIDALRGELRDTIWHLRDTRTAFDRPSPLPSADISDLLDLISTIVLQNGKKRS